MRTQPEIERRQKAAFNPSGKTVSLENHEANRTNTLAFYDDPGWRNHRGARRL
jgi:hypothetical protein